ncbi:hypothetical protein HZ994_13120 [Akkermansiaceae bacterium]|nr:hypothetical protein HZ994_13120 [Akkermansiaceae bacterium]
MKCILTCLLLGFAHASAHAAGPGEAALDFLEKVREGGLNLEPGGDTALQPGTAQGKLRSIRKGIERLDEDLGGAVLELGEVMEDDGFAAVIVRKPALFDSSEMQVYPVALVKVGAAWLPAPVLASYENAVAAYTLPIREKLSRLEGWMMEKRVTDLGGMMADSTLRMRQRIRESIVGEHLEGDDLGTISQAFLDACAAKDRAAILGFLGGLSDPFPQDWPARLAASRHAVESRGAWRLLADPEVVRIPLFEERDGKSGMLTIACLDPSMPGFPGTMGRIRLLFIDVEKDGSGQWRLELPSSLLSGNADFSEDGDDLDADLMDLFPKRLRELDPAIHAPGAREAADGVMASLKSGTLRETLRRVDFGRQGKEGRIACSDAAKLWWKVHGSGALRMPLELGFREEGDSAAAVFQWFSVADPDRFEPVTLFFRKSADGWLWCPGIVPSDGMEDHRALSEWAKAGEGGWRKSWRTELMKSGTPLGSIDFGRVASDEEIRSVLADWMGALESKDIRRALSLSAWLGREGEIPMKALRNLSYDLSSYKEGSWKPGAIHRSASWAAATLRQADGDKARHAFIPIVVTAAGARLLPEIDLFSEDTRTRNFLNETSFERLGRFVGKDRLEELRALFDGFKKASIE